MKIEIAAPEEEFMIIKSEKLAKYPNIQAVDKFLKAASVLNQTQGKLAQDAMKLANVSWEDAQGIDLVEKNSKIDKSGNYVGNITWKHDFLFDNITI